MATPYITSESISCLSEIIKVDNRVVNFKYDDSKYANFIKELHNRNNTPSFGISVLTIAMARVTREFNVNKFIANIDISSTYPDKYNFNSSLMLSEYYNDVQGEECE